MDHFERNLSSQSGISSNIPGQSSGPSGSETANEDEPSDNQDDDPSSSSTSSSPVSFHHELDNFRIQWRRELESSPNPSSSNLATANESATQEVDVFKKAKKFFLQGVQKEKAGKLYEAISFYKRAVQLVPNIEFHLAESHGFSAQNSSSDECSVESDNLEDDLGERCVRNDNDDDDENNDVTDLVMHIERVLIKSGPLQTCQPAREQKMTHLSALPTEVLIYILKWIVSSDLDLHSLERVGGVCRGFYLCSRDSEIWRLACTRIWGLNSGLPNKYGSWRNMFLSRPHLWFNGVYISKTTYVRFGESSFQDTNYKPCYMVEYFRYLRFFPDGLVLMLTTPDDPYQSISRLRQARPQHAAVLRGHYRLVGSNVTAILKRPQVVSGSMSYNSLHNRRHRRQPLHPATDTGEESFHLELDVQPVKKKPHCKLQWRHYTLHTVYRNCQETVSEFDLTPANYPPFWFSRVRSFTTDLPLE